MLVSDIPSPPPDLQARLASARRKAEALGPALAEVVAVQREALGEFNAMIPADADPATFCRWFEELSASAGADAVRRVVIDLTDTLAMIDEPPVSRVGAIG